MRAGVAIGVPYYHSYYARSFQVGVGMNDILEAAKVSLAEYLPRARETPTTTLDLLKRGVSLRSWVLKLNSLLQTLEHAPLDRGSNRSAEVLLLLEHFKELEEEAAQDLASWQAAIARRQSAEIEAHGMTLQALRASRSLPEKLRSSASQPALRDDDVSSQADSVGARADFDAAWAVAFGLEPKSPPSSLGVIAQPSVATQVAAQPIIDDDGGWGMDFDEVSAPASQQACPAPPLGDIDSGADRRLHEAFVAKVREALFRSLGRQTDAEGRDSSVAPPASSPNAHLAALQSEDSVLGSRGAQLRSRSPLALGTFAELQRTAGKLDPSTSSPTDPSVLSSRDGSKLPQHQLMVTFHPRRRGRGPEDACSPSLCPPATDRAAFRNRGPSQATGFLAQEVAPSSGASLSVSGMQLDNEITAPSVTAARGVLFSESRELEHTESDEKLAGELLDLVSEMKERSLAVLSRLRSDNSALESTAIAAEANLDAVGGANDRLARELGAVVGGMCTTLTLLVVAVVLFFVAYVFIRFWPAPPSWKTGHAFSFFLVQGLWRAIIRCAQAAFDMAVSLVGMASLHDMSTLWPSMSGIEL